MSYRKILLIATDMPAGSKIFVLMLSIFAPLKAVIFVILFLVIVDMITSIYYQMQQVRKEKKFFRHLVLCFRIVESHKLRRTISKLLFYVLSLMAFFLFDVYLLKIKPLEGDVLATFSVTNLAAILIGVTELTSIASNVSKITGNPIFGTIMRIFGNKVNERLNITQQDENNTQPQTNH